MKKTEGTASVAVAFRPDPDLDIQNPQIRNLSLETDSVSLHDFKNLVPARKVRI
jgi:hypothetical protein